MTADTSRRLARNTIFSAVGEGSNVFIFALGLIAARVLGPVDFGVFTAAFAYVSVFRLLPDLGMSYAATLDISRDRTLAGRVAGNLLGFQAVLSVLTLVVCLGLGRILFHDVMWPAVVILSADLVFKSLKNTLRWLLKAFESFGAEATSLLIERVSLFALGLAVLFQGGGVLAFVAVFAVVRLFDTSGLFVYVHRRLPLVPRRDPGVWGELLRKGIPFAYAGVMITLFFYVDAVILERMRGAEEAGWYGAPVRVLEGLTLVPRILSFALIPTMASVYATAPEKVTELYRRGTKYLLVAGLPVAAFGLLASDRLMPLLFDRKYEPSIAAAEILIPSAAFMFLSNFGETTLACINRWTTIVGASTAALVLNVVLNLLWIPRHGYVGAAWATLATEATYALLIAATLIRQGHDPQWIRTSLRPLAATAAFAAVLWTLRDAGLIASSVAASIVFAIATLVLGVWDARELALVRDVARRRGAAPAAGL